MPLTIWNCVLSYKQKSYFCENPLVLPRISVKTGLFFQEITLRKEFPGSNSLLPTFLTGGKWDFQVANLLLATVNFEPRYMIAFFFSFQTKPQNMDPYYKMKLNSGIV